MTTRPKTISIFGATGSIGKNVTEILLNNTEAYSVIALTANNDIKTLAQTARKLHPQYVVIAADHLYQELKILLEDLPQIKVLAGANSINEVAKIKCDLFISAIVGIAALIPTINAIRAGSNIGLANKECLVSAGEIILKEVESAQIKLIPIDSEHNAIFQIFENDNIELIESITITASGGPFLKMNFAEMRHITKAQALKHPNWLMGEKISIDCATMINKGLEMIEAFHLFPIKKEQINIIIHPESIIHGMVNYKDGATLAMMSKPDMKIPISFALAYPKRASIQHQKFDLTKIAALNFFSAEGDDFDKKFLGLNLARAALKQGGNAPCILNAADEIAVEKFLKNQIAFMDISKIIAKVLEKIPHNPLSSLEDVASFNDQARMVANNININQ